MERSILLKKWLAVCGTAAVEIHNMRYCGIPKAGEGVECSKIVCHSSGSIINKELWAQFSASMVAC